MSRRVLMIAYYFPPLGGIGSLRATRFAEHLPEFGWEPTVLAPRAGTFYRDPGLPFPERRVVRSRSIELTRIGKRTLRIDPSADSPDTRRTRLHGALRSLAHRYLYRPDPQIGWYPGAVRAGSSALRNGEYDAVFSSSVPMTAHLIARRLRRSRQLPWIAEFRDPWSGRAPSGDRERAARLEEAIASDATEIVMTSPTWAREHSERWGRPVRAILAGADPAPRSEASTDLVVAHLGTFYPGQQDLSAAWRGLRRAIDREDLPPLRLRFIGELSPPLREQLHEEGLMGITEVTGFVQHAKALELLSGSSVLLAAGPCDARESLRGLIPAKLLEYLATDIPIIYVSHTPNDGADLLMQHPGCRVVPVGDPDAFTEALLAFNGNRFERDADTLSWRSRTAELASILERSQ